MALYSDLNAISPTRVPLVYDEQAVYSALYNLFNTRPGERIFEPEFGIALEDELFELMDELGALGVFNAVTIAVGRWEPRVRIDTGATQVIPVPNENRFELHLVFNIVGVDEKNFTMTGSFST